MTRLELHSALCAVLGSSNVYYQPPTGLQMKFPCIIYSKDDWAVTKADNTAYLSKWRYSVQVVSKTPDHPAIETLLAWPYADFDREYTDGNMYYDIIKIYT